MKLKQIFENSLFINSVKNIQLRLLFMITFLSMCFFATMQGLTFVFSKLMQGLGLQELMVQSDLLQSFSSVSEETYTEFIRILNQKVVASFVYIIFFAVFSVIIWSIFEGIILTKLYNKKHYVKMMLKFFFLNIPAFFLFILLQLLFLEIPMEMLSVWLTRIFTFLISYFLVIASFLLFKHENLKKSILGAFKIGTLKLYRFLIPLGLIILIFFVVLFLTAVLANFIPNPIFIFILVFVVFNIVWAWARLYFKRIVDKVDDAVK